MATGERFTGFPKAAAEFLNNLKKNNNKEWFAGHKSVYERDVIKPAADFVYDMGKRLEKIAAGIIADPRTDKSIFRIYRDTRFSKDKVPYKTHLGIFLWEGKRPKMECPGFYFHLEPPHLMLGVGIHGFSKPLLQEYRDSVVHPKHGLALEKALKDVTKKREYEIGIKHFKMTPRGYDSNHKNAELLLYNGLTAVFMTKIPQEMHSRSFLDYAYAKFKDMSPIHRWLLDMIGRVG